MSILKPFEPGHLIGWLYIVGVAAYVIGLLTAILRWVASGEEAKSRILRNQHRPRLQVLKGGRLAPKGGRHA